MILRINQKQRSNRLLELLIMKLGRKSLILMDGINLNLQNVFKNMKRKYHCVILIYRIYPLIIVD